PGASSPDDRPGGLERARDPRVRAGRVPAHRHHASLRARPGRDVARRAAHGPARRRAQIGGEMRFHTTILTAGKTAAGIRIPADVLATLGSSRKPAVRVTIKGYTYRSTVAWVNGAPMVGVSVEN